MLRMEPIHWLEGFWRARPWLAAPARREPRAKASERSPSLPTRDEVPRSRTPAAVTVINRDKLESGVQRRIAEALSDVPGVCMRGSAFDGNRPGNSVGTINMRGIPGAARTLFLVDGIPFNSPLASLTRLFDLNVLMRVRVIAVAVPF